MSDPAEVAYEAYSRSTRGLTHDGRPMPAWGDLGPAIQSAWQAAAVANTGSATQTRHPWRAVTRTVVAAIIALVPVLIGTITELGLSGPVVVTALAVLGGVTRVLAMPVVNRWLEDYVPWLAAEPRQP